MFYLEQMYKKLLNLFDNLVGNITSSVISKCGTFSLFLSLVILFSVLQSNFAVSGVKSSR